MGATHISPEQLHDIQRLRDSGAPAQQVWARLAQYGDTYAEGAVKVFRPDSNGWYTVRAIWDVTGADMSKFQTVAHTHMNQYISMMENANEKGHYRLPNSAQIEDSYVHALEKSGLRARTAIDVVISKIKEDGSRLPPHWYDTPDVMWLNKEREAPSYSSVLSKIDGEDAKNIYRNVAGSVAQQETQEAYLRTDRKMPQMAKDGSWEITPIQGINFYRNSRTENWAIYDKNGEGILYLDGHKEQINHSNFRLRPDAQHEFLKDGRWQIVELDKTLNLNNKVNPNFNQNDPAYAQILVTQEPIKTAGRTRLDNLLAANESGDDAILRKATSALYESPVGQNIMAQASATVDAQERQQAFDALQALEAQKQALAQQEMDAPVRRGSVMRMG